MGWINNEGSMASFKKGGKVKKKPSYKKTKQERKMEVIEANLSPRDKFKGTDEEFIKSRKGRKSKK